MSEESTPKPPARGNPPDWRERWNVPLLWPGEEFADPQAQQQARRSFQPVLAESALLMIDVDKKSFDRQIEGVSKHDQPRGAELARWTYAVALPNCIRLVDYFRAKQRPVIFVQWGWHRFQYPPLAARAGEDVVIKKTRGAFASSDLDEVLRRHNIRTCIAAGADTGVCVTSTACGAIDRGYRAAIVEDACVALRFEAHDAALRVLAHMGAAIVSTEQVVA